MTVTVQSFRQSFREFSDPGAFPDDAVQLWLGFASSMVNTDVWNTDGGTLADLGTCLVIAHHLTLAARDLAASANGIPGEVKGPMTAKSVDKVSVSMDVNAVALEGAGFWNMTSYGIRFLTLARTVGAGGMQLGGCGVGPGPYGPPFGYA